VTAGNLELVQIVAFLVVTLPMVICVIVRDEKLLEGAELERAWPPVSRDAAIFGLYYVGLHPLCVLIHFVRTRRSVRGAVLGVVWLTAIVALGIGAQFGAADLVERVGL
jgi:hypothetical protein